jgi:hypothetical protein
VLIIAHLGVLCSDNRRLIELLKPAGPEMHDGETERDLPAYEVSDHLRICIEGEINTCRKIQSLLFPIGISASVRKHPLESK